MIKNRNRMQRFANSFPPILGRMECKHRMFNVQTEKLFFCKYTLILKVNTGFGATYAAVHDVCLVDVPAHFSKTVQSHILHELQQCGFKTGLAAAQTCLPLKMCGTLSSKKYNNEDPGLWSNCSHMSSINTKEFHDENIKISDLSFQTLTDRKRKGTCCRHRVQNECIFTIRLISLNV